MSGMLREIRLLNMLIILFIFQESRALSNRLVAILIPSPGAVCLIATSSIRVLRHIRRSVVGVGIKDAFHSNRNPK